MEIFLTEKPYYDQRTVTDIIDRLAVFAACGNGVCAISDRYISKRQEYTANKLGICADIGDTAACGELV